MNNIFKIRTYLLIAFVGCQLMLFSQGDTTTQNQPNAPWYGWDIDTILIIIALLLLVPLYYSSSSFLSAIKLFAKKQSDKITVLFLFLASYQIGFAQDTAEAATTSASGGLDLFTYLLIALVMFQIFLIGIFTWQTTKFFDASLKTEAEDSSYVYNEDLSLWQTFKNKWNKSNNFVGAEEEAKLDTGHDYDGIRELDNGIPPWFQAAFIITILFSIFYFYQRHIAYSVPDQKQEYELEMAAAEIEVAKYLETQGNQVDENSVVALTGADIEAGKQIFKEKCLACHNESGASMPGGVGPNLTDDYWLHGGDIKSIFKVIKYGVPDKGMISWSSQISPKAMAQVSSFIVSINGTNVAGGKEPQGELYKPEATTVTETPADTTATPKEPSTEKK